MSANKNIIIKKGLNIDIPGTAQKTVVDLPTTGLFAVKPTDHIGLSPRLLVGEGDAVVAGTPLIVDKNNEAARLVSPVNGKVKSVVRGEKRALLAVVVEQDAAAEEQQLLSAEQMAATDREMLIETLIKTGLWSAIKQRPFGITPLRDAKPKAVFISAFDNSPLPVDIPFMLAADDFQRGVEILHHIAGPIHIALAAGDDSALTRLQHADIRHYQGPHPASLVGTQIAYTNPINKGETVWTLNAQDVAVIGHLFRTGYYRPQRLVALCGPMVKQPQYYRCLAGASLAPLAANINATAEQKVRLISGSVLSGTTLAADDYLSASCDKVSVLPEGDYYDFMGWLRPNFKKFSFSHTFLSGFCAKHMHKLQFDTGRHGDHRPLFVTGEFEKLVPLDIYPMQLIKACIAGNIERMEELGIYEVEPEDLALCEFADTSKTEIQAAIRKGLETIRKEG